MVGEGAIPGAIYLRSEQMNFVALRVNELPRTPYLRTSENNPSSKVVNRVCLVR